MIGGLVKTVFPLTFVSNTYAGYNLKCVFVGDPQVGKTCSQIVYASKAFPKPTDHVPACAGAFSANVEVDGKVSNLGLWDTPSGDDYERLRPISYPATDIFLVLFSVVDPVSMQNVKQKWVPEIQQHAIASPFILVGTKTDLRNDRDVLEKLREKNLKASTEQEGHDFAKEIGAENYMEISALTQEGMDELFEEAIRTAIDKPAPGKSRGKCIVS